MKNELGHDRLGAAITPYTSRSSPGTHRLDCPETVDGRGNEGCAFVFPTGGLFRTLGAFLCTIPLLLGGGDILSAQNRAESKPVTTPVRTVADTAQNIELIRPDEPIDLTLQMYLQRQETDDTTLFAPRRIADGDLLRAGELDSLNPQGKEGEITIPLRGYPAPDDPPRPNRPVYLEGSFGLNTTAMLRGGISGSTWPFNYRASLDYFSTEGHSDLNEGNNLSVELAGGYVIGLGYGMFSGGTMGGEAGYRQTSWRLHGIESSPMRENSNWHLGAHTSAGLGGIDLGGKLGVTTWNLQQSIPPVDGGAAAAGSVATLEMSSIEGILDASTGTGPLKWTSRVDLRLSNSSLGALDYGGLSLAAAIGLGPLNLRAGGKLSSARGSDGGASTLLVPTAELRFRPFDGMTLTGKLDGGVRQARPDSVLSLNPYGAIAGTFLPDEERRGIEVTLRLEPSMTWGLTLGAARRDFARLLHFDGRTAGEFAPVYDQVEIDRLEGDFFFHPGPNDRIALLLRLTDAERSDQTTLPYTPTTDAEIFYHRRLISVPIRTGGSIRYIGERSSASGSLDPVLLLNLDWSYSLGSLVEIFLTARNLLGVDYEIWEGYEERGLFFSIGVRATL